MKKIIFLLSISILCRPALPLLDYLVNYDYIAKELCINKEKPVMGCNGKCYLMKELAKAAESEKPVSSDKKHVVFEKTDLFFEVPERYTVINLPQDQNKSIQTTKTLHANPHLQSVLKPPITVS